MIQIRTVLLVALVLSVSGSFSSLCAQEEQSPFSGKKVVELKQSDRDKVAMARRLIASQRFQEAADLLETYYETDPDDRLVLNLLKTCYEQLRQYPKAEILLRRMIEKEPRSIGHRLSLAEVLVKLDNEPEALKAYDEVTAMVRGTDPTRLVVVLRSLIQSGLDDEALARIDEARISFGRANLFAVERGGILESRRQYRAAAMEYLPLLSPDSSIEAGRGEKRLMALLAFEESASEVEELLVASIDSTSGPRTIRLLSDHFLKAGRFDEAFAYVMRLDSLEGGSGLPLLGFMRRCEERRQWSKVVRIAEILLQQHPGSRFETETSFQNARALAELGRAEEAIGIYARLFERVDEPQTKADALYGQGVIHFEYLHDYDRALIYFDSVIDHYPRGRSYVYARKTVPMCHLHRGRLDAARRSLLRMSVMSLPEDIREEVDFHIVLIDFFSSQYDSAETALRKLMVDYPRGYYVNDALRLVLAIGEAAEARETLDDYSAALFLQYRGVTDSARTRYYAIADRESAVLGDLVLYKLIDLELERADSAAVIEVVDRLDREHPESYYRPLGLKIKADLLAGAAETMQQARELYRSLLEQYPEYPFAREVREKLRALEREPPVG